MYTPGQKVVCINASAATKSAIPPLKQGEIYTVRAVLACSCGVRTIDVGIPLDDRECVVCAKCNAKTESTIWWFREERFAPLEEKSSTMFEDVLKEWQTPQTESTLKHE